jgi:hypothetical protein
VAKPEQKNPSVSSSHAANDDAQGRPKHLVIFGDDMASPSIRRNKRPGTRQWPHIFARASADTGTAF